MTPNSLKFGTSYNDLTTGFLNEINFEVSVTYISPIKEIDLSIVYGCSQRDLYLVAL